MAQIVNHVAINVILVLTVQMIVMNVPLMIHTELPTQHVTVNQDIMKMIFLPAHHVPTHVQHVLDHPLSVILVREQPPELTMLQQELVSVLINTSKTIMKNVMLVTINVLLVKLFQKIV